MKDLYVLAADADMAAVFQTIPGRPEALGIRPIEFEVGRHLNRDAGVRINGPEYLRDERKNHDFHRFIIAFDYEGSGYRGRPDECANMLQTRLDTCSFTGRSRVVIIDPELEAWLCCDLSMLGDTGGVESILDPKKRLEQAFLRTRRRPIRVRDFEQIASRADLNLWTSSPSFRILKETLQNWFPRP